MKRARELEKENEKILQNETCKDAMRALELAMQKLHTAKDICASGMKCVDVFEKANQK
ncbi:hypothetical protein [Roseburia faecis]|uniref:hypothetical protein n=1 Tax=Roseburia faecis TaxID=301302 RepID=UPI00189B0806|nr:hypothetical protein [Roseburia faecis]